MRISNRKIFGLHPKVMLPQHIYALQFCGNYIGLSNQGNYYEIEVQFVKQDVATWLFDAANIFQFDIFIRKQRPTG
jgi:hypothetical protein